MVGLYDHQLLVWPRLIHKALPQLRMKTRARCCCWGHYRDPTTHFSTSLSQLLQGNPVDCFQFSFQWCFFGATLATHTGFTCFIICTGCTRVIVDNTLLMFFESALPGVVISTSNLVKWNLLKEWLSCRESLVSLHNGVGVQPLEFHLNKHHDNMPGKL